MRFKLELLVEYDAPIFYLVRRFYFGAVDGNRRFGALSGISGEVDHVELFDENNFATGAYVSK